jgi:hypothetical protein
VDCHEKLIKTNPDRHMPPISVAVSLGLHEDPGRDHEIYNHAKMRS